jgi:exopolysaccharide biosynthesis polyprenyl glycosylphosphotransferase
MSNPSAQAKSRGYSNRLAVSDFFAIAIAVTASYYLMFDDIAKTFASASAEGTLRISLNPPAVAWAVGVVWAFTLRVNKSRDHRIIGSDSEEYKRVLNASLSILGLLAIAALFLKLDVSRLFIATTLLLGTALLLTTRWVWRQWLRRMRANGKFRNTAAIAGPANLIIELVDNLNRDKGSPFMPTLLIASSLADAEKLKKLDIPIEIKLEDPANQLGQRGIDALILTGSDYLTNKNFKQIAWNLETSPIDLLIAPGLLEAAGPRVHTRPVAGMPLLEIESPKFEGSRYAIKQTFDIVVAAIITVLVLPILLATAIAVKATDKGPAFFFQERHGKNGKPFKMIKFRSMRVGAEKLHEELKKQKQKELTNSNMFKDPNDPRITKIGKFIRRYSIDELPQLFNVLKGDMSLVGPRPPLPSEVAEYESHVHRRLLVKPGITGIWQVSGRASLSWEETVRLDLDYVENWAFTRDLVILGKTVGVIFGKSGAF